jgi:hypothetical protein
MTTSNSIGNAYNRVGGGAAIDGASISSDGATAPGGASLLPDADTSGNVGMMIAKLLLENDDARKELAKQDRRAAEADLKAEQTTQLSEMKEAADKRQAAGEEEAWGKMISGGLELGAAVAPLAAPSGSLLLDPKVDAAIGNGAGTAINGAFTLDASGKTREAADADQRSKAAEMAASEAKSRVDDARDDKRAAEDAVGRVLDWLGKMQDLSADTARSALGGH